MDKQTKANMIQANELRIGNFIRNEMNHTIEVSHDTLVNIVEFDTIYQLIPLTEDWLVRFGFTYRYGTDDWMISSQIFDFCLDATDDGFIYDWQTKIKCVHQLQNLYFALTGEKLKLR